MHHTRGMDCIQALSEPRGQPQQRRGRQWSAAGHRIGEGWPGYVRGGQPRHRPVWISIHNWRRVYATDLPRSSYLPGEPGTELCVFGQFCPDHLDGEMPAAR